MPEIKIKVRDKCAEGEGVIICNNSDYAVVWDLDGEWAPYGTKTMRVNLADGTYQDVVFTGDNAALPVLTASGWVSVGLYAGDIHTTRAARLLALSSVLTPGGAPAAPAEDVYAQIMAKLNELSTVSPEDIAKAVADYLAAHPIKETDPTVPEWAKAETKPTYSAAEVGAIAQSDLQAATDAALAQAKSSGEFDGAAGPRGPAGAPGKDGAGMDITGATVGQIAKIAAVDSNGAPTAWSPVDIPSGGGEELRLIRTINVSSDDLNSIYFNVDDENRPFNLHRVVFAMYGAPTNTGSKQAALFFRGGDKNLGADHEQATYGVQVNSGAYNYVFGFIFEIYNVGGLWFGDSAYGKSQVSKVDRYVPSSKSTDASISEIKLLWNALDVYFPNGSTIEVWGA